MANVVLKWLGNKLLNGTKTICTIKGNTVKVDKTNLGDLIDVNTEELEEDVERALLGNHVYSTTERVCGEWIDGRNIYEKTVTLENAIDVTTSETQLSGFPSDIDKLISFEYSNTHEQISLNVWSEDGVTFKVATVSGRASIKDYTITYIKNERE